MKRLMHIFISALLSIMIVMMGSGVIIVHCNHTGTTKVVTYNQACEKRCKTTSKCMKTTVLKFSTMSQVQQHTLDYKLPVVILPWLQNPLFELKEIITTMSDALRYEGSSRHGPPRKYLNLLCILLI